MAIDIGDAILTFTLDQSQGMAQLDQLGAEIPAKMQPAQAAINATSESVEKMTEQMTVGQNGAVKLGEVMNLAGEESRESMYEARGEVELLGEMIGVRLPRHVRSFISELPGVGSALSAAFQATAIIFIIDALVQVGEKITEFTHRAEKISEAWDAVHESEQQALDHLTNDLIKAQVETDKLTGDHLGALLLELQLIDRTTLSNLRNEFIKLEKEADKAFESMDANMFESLLGGFEGSGEAKGVFDTMAKSVNDALATGKADSFLKALNAINAAATTASERLKTATLPADQLEAWAEINKRAEAYRELLEQTAALDWQEKLNDALNLVKQQETDLEQRAKRTMEARIEAAKAAENAEHDAFNQGKISAEEWAQAQSKATDETAKAHVDYANSIAAIVKQQEQLSEQLKTGSINVQQWIDAQKRSADSSKSVAAAQDAQTEKLKEWNSVAKAAEDSLTKAQAETAKLRDEMFKLVFPVDKAHEQTQAFKALEAAENKLAEAQKTLAEAQVSADFSEQKAAITQLANLRIISKEQEAQMLARLNQQEERDAMTALNQLLAQQEQALNVAKAKFEQASKDVLFSPAELADLKAHLDEAQAAYDKTQTEIVKRSAQFNSQLISQSRGYYGEALALAVASGNQILAEKLKENHAALLVAEGELAEAKARKVNTDAIQNEIKHLQNIEKELTKEARTGKTVNAGLISEFAQLSKTIAAYDAELQDSGSKTAAWGASIGTVLSEVAQAYAAGAVSIEQALAKVAAAEISAIAQVAEKEGTKQLALAFGSYPDFAGMAQHFASATLWFGLAGGLSAASGALSGSGSGRSSSASSSNAGVSAGNPTNLAGGSQPTQVINVTHLASGGLVTGPTLAVIGDSASGGSSREAVLPLDNGPALKAIANAISAQMKNMGGYSEVPQIHLHGSLAALVSEINYQTKSGRIRLHATTSDKTIRKA